jgi:hypothetical protein
MPLARFPNVLIFSALALGLSYCIFVVGRQSIAEWHHRQPGLQDARKAVAWNENNAIYHAALARILEWSGQGSQLNEAAQHYKRATELSPYSGTYWAELAGAMELEGQVSDAENAYVRARQLAPYSPLVNWHLGNFYIRQARTAEALPCFKVVLQGDPGLSRQAFDLAWRAGADPALILEAMIPPEPDVLLQYVSYLGEKKRIDESIAAWERLVSLQMPFALRKAFPFVHYLIQNHRVDQAGSVWDDLARLHPTEIRKQAYDGNLITNGDFEGLILNGGLGWQVVPDEGVVVRVDSLEFFDGTRSLRIDFDGTNNITYRHIYQYVPVRPNTVYRFGAYLRARGITSDSGPQIQLFDYYEPTRLNHRTSNRTGTQGWEPEQLQFETGADTNLLVVRVARPKGRTFDSQIAGTVWIDRVTLVPAER